AQKEYYGIFALLNNCDEPTIDVQSVEVATRRAEVEKEIAAPGAGLSEYFPPDPPPHPGGKRTAQEIRRAHLEAPFSARLKVEREKTVNWTVLKPTSAKGNVPLLTIESDGTVFVSGDKSKHDVYDLTFRTDLKDITAIRIEALPDDRLPNRGPGRVNYEGPFGDFFLCEVTLANDGRPQHLGAVTADYFDGNNKPQNAAARNPLTGWSINGGQGRAHAIVFNLAEPIRKPGKLEL